MTDKEKLYDAFGELVYAIAIADGYVQPVESEKLKQLLSKHEWAKEIEWSFNYEVNAKSDLDDVYEKALDAFAKIGPQPEYEFMIEVLEQVARASHGIDQAEEKVVADFKVDLLERFTRDLERIKRNLEVE